MQVIEIVQIIVSVNLDGWVKLWQITSSVPKFSPATTLHYFGIMFHNHYLKFCPVAVFPFEFKEAIVVHNREGRLYCVCNSYTMPIRALP